MTDDLEAITLTESAADRIRSLIGGQGFTPEEYGVRLFVQAGGCSGFMYGMALESAPHESDTVYESQGLRVILDEASLPYLRGTTVAYDGDLLSGGFRFENPNSIGSCGCGNSFRTEDGGCH